MAKTESDVVLSWFSSGSVAASAFQRPTRFIQLPTPAGQGYKAQIAGFGQQPIRAIMKQFAPDVRPMRIAVLGFSEGCQGVRAMLSSPDGGRIDCAVAIDGVHAQYQAGSKTKIVPAYLTPYGAMGKRAAQGRVLLCLTASSIRPPGFASTTETAAWIWDYVTGGTAETASSPIPELLTAPLQPPVTFPGGKSGGNTWTQTTYDQPPVSAFRREHGLIVVNYADVDPTGHNDHVLQAKVVLPDMLQAFVAQRWNQTAPQDGICTLSGIPDIEEAGDVNGCFPPMMLSDLYLDGQAEPRPLDIPLDSEVDPTIPGAGPPAKPAETPPPPQDDSSPMSSGRKAFWWVAGISAGAVIAGVTTNLVFGRKSRRHT